jgi:hypothetical protein
MFISPLSLLLTCAPGLGILRALCLAPYHIATWPLSWHATNPFSLLLRLLSLGFIFPPPSALMSSSPPLPIPISHPFRMTYAFTCLCPPSTLVLFLSLTLCPCARCVVPACTLSLLELYTPLLMTSPFLPVSFKPPLFLCMLHAPDCLFHLVSLMPTLVLVLIPTMHNKEMVAPTSSKSLSQICSHASGHPTADWESKRNGQGGMYHPPILDSTIFKFTWVFSIRHQKLHISKGW